MERLNWHPRPRTLAVSGLIESNGWKTGAELGVWYGVTTTYLLEKHPNLSMFAVDSWKIRPEGTLEKYTPGEHGHSWNHNFYEEQFKKKLGKNIDRCNILKMDTDDAARIVEDNSLDFVFIDADHSTEGVLNDIKNWLPKLKDTGWLLGDDIDWDSVKTAVEQTYPDYKVFNNIVWAIPKACIG